MARLIYDGDCKFCTRTAGWAAKRLKRGHTIIARQDAGLGNAQHEESAKSVLWIGEHLTRNRSAAVVQAFWHMHGAWPAAGAALWLIPRPLRDWGYVRVAKRWGPL